MSSYIAVTVLLLLVIYPIVFFSLVCGKVPIFSWNIIVPTEFGKALGLPFELSFPCDITQCNLDKTIEEAFDSSATSTADSLQDLNTIMNAFEDGFEKIIAGQTPNDSLQALGTALVGKDPDTIMKLIQIAVIQAGGTMSEVKKIIKKELKHKEKLFEYATYPSIALYVLALLLLLISFVCTKGQTTYLTLWRSTILFTVFAFFGNLAFCSMMGLYIIGARDKLKKIIGEEGLKMFKLNMSPVFVNLCIAPALLLGFTLVCLCFKVPIGIQPEKSQVQLADAAAAARPEPDAKPAEANETTPLLSNKTYD